MEPSVPLHGRSLFYSNGNYYYITGAEVGANAVTESTFNLWVLKSADGGQTWARIVNYFRPTYINYEFLSAAQTGTKIWIIMNINGTGGHVPGTEILSLDTTNDTFITSYPLSTTVVNPAGLGILPDNTPILVCSAGIQRFNGSTWDSLISIPTPPSALRAVVWDSSRLYIIAATAACLTVSLPSLTPSTWQSFTLPASPSGPREIGYPAISNGKLAIPIRIQSDIGSDVSYDLYSLCGPVGDSGSLTLTSTLITLGPSLQPKAQISSFNILPWYSASLLDINGVLHCFYVVANPLDSDTLDKSFLYHQYSTACGAWSSPEILYNTPISQDLITPYPVKISNTEYSVLLGSINPVLFLNVVPGSKYASLSIFIITPCPVAQVLPTLTVTCNNPPQGINTNFYSHQVLISNGIAPYGVTISSGALPSGLIIDNTGLISGIISSNAGNYTFIIRVIDAISRVATVECSIYIAGCNDSITNPVSSVWD